MEDFVPKIGFFATIVVPEPLETTVMKTTPVYLDNPYQKELTAQIVEVLPEKEGIWRIILDQTIFYPMGGGQPTDQGKLVFPDGSIGEVYQVLLKEGEINHYVKIAAEPTVGMTVTGTIDWERRYKNMRVHSGGHIVDFAMYLLGYSPSPLSPMKGDHGKKPFVLYQGTLTEDIKEKLQKQADELIANNRNFSWKFELLENMEKEAIYLQPGLPQNKPLRALKLEGVGVVADGGTIVSTTQEVGKVTITAIESVEGSTRVHYQVV